MTDLSTITIRIDDARKAGYCVDGVKRWWPFQNYAVSFSAFLKDGLPGDEFVAGGDDHARVTVDKKLERENG